MDFDLTDSEDDFSEEDKLLLDNARNLLNKKSDSDEKGVFGLVSDEDEEDEDNYDEDYKDDEEGLAFDDEDDENADDLADDFKVKHREEDDRAWGLNKKRFYNTDFVDPDFEGFYEGKQAEEAELEEQEAKKIQKRLIEQLNDADFSLTDIIGEPEAAKIPEKKELIKSDLSSLSSKQKLELFKKQSPEFFILVDDFKSKLKEVQTDLMPLLDLVNKKTIPMSSAVNFIRTKVNVILNYCTNISFYLLLKVKGIAVKNHPVLKSLYKYRQLLQQMKPVDDKIIKPQLDAILKKYVHGKEVDLNNTARVTKKKILKLLQKSQEKKENDEMIDEFLEHGEDEEEDDKAEEPMETDNKNDDKRAITYEMAKNKGLIPKRKKEKRNPRVKHRNKYKKALVRRKGQVRLPRTEIPVYGGEATGVKIDVTKSVKFK